MLHRMKLQPSPFERIKEGKKPVEFRLFDEKRRQIKIGDQIEFSKLPDLQEKVVVDVLDLYKDKTFNSLFNRLLSDKKEIERKTESMLRFYSHEDEAKYGVLGIKIKINTSNLKNQIK